LVNPNLSPESAYKFYSANFEMLFSHFAPDELVVGIFSAAINLGH